MLCCFQKQFIINKNIWIWTEEKVTSHKYSVGITWVKYIPQRSCFWNSLLAGKDKCCSKITPPTSNFASFFGSGRDKYRNQKTPEWAFQSIFNKSFALVGVNEHLVFPEIWLISAGEQDKSWIAHKEILYVSRSQDARN